MPSLLVGVALGNVIRGVPMDAQGNYIGTFWELLNLYALLVGVTGLCLIAQHGAAWLAVKSEGELHERALKYRRTSFWVCAVLAVATSVATIVWVPRASDLVFGRAAGWLFLVVFLLGVLYTIRQMYKPGGELRSFIGSAVIIIGLAGIAAVGNFPAMVPARGTPLSTSLTVENASSGSLTLAVMLIITIIFCPIVLLYTAYVYKTFWGKTKATDADY